MDMPGTRETALIPHGKDMIFWIGLNSAWNYSTTRKVVILLLSITASMCCCPSETVVSLSSSRLGRPFAA